MEGLVKPPEALERLQHDECIPLARAATSDTYRPDFLRAVDWGLKLDSGSRPQTIADWQAGLYPWKNLSRASALNRLRGRKIFISYRRSDSRPGAIVLYDYLVRNLSADDLFFDVDTIPKGVDFRNHIRGSIIDSAVMLAVMGPGWIGRLQGKPWQFWRSAREDFVSIELESAIENGIPILPVLVRGAQMPTASALPTALKVMTYANAAELRSGKFQMRDLEHIAAAIRQFRD